MEKYGKFEWWMNEEDLKIDVLEKFRNLLKTK